MASDPIKILIVDDDEEVLIAPERLLESEGYSTATEWGGGKRWPCRKSCILTCCWSMSIWGSRRFYAS